MKKKIAIFKTQYFKGGTFTDVARNQQLAFEIITEFEKKNLKKTCQLKHDRDHKR